MVFPFFFPPPRGRFFFSPYEGDGIRGLCGPLFFFFDMVYGVSVMIQATFFFPLSLFEEPSTLFGLRVCGFLFI